MPKPLLLHPDRLFPAQENTRDIARRLYQHIENLPIVSPHGHTDASWFARNEPFADATELLVKPDHYVFRMLYSQGIPLSALGLGTAQTPGRQTDNREVWRLFAQHYYLFRGTPSRMWLDTVFHEVFGIEVALDATTADFYFDRIGDLLSRPDFLPRALFERFNIELLATTESPLDDLRYHRQIRNSDWDGKLISTFRPDPGVDPLFEGFTHNVARLAEITGTQTDTWNGYLLALGERRDFFRSMGATSTDHGHPTANTEVLPVHECEALFKKALAGRCSSEEAERLRGQMLTEMAAMSIEDGLVMQIHPGSFRNHNSQLFTHFGRDGGADIPTETEYVKALKPLLGVCRT